MPDRPEPVDLLEFVGPAGRQYVLEPEPAATRRRTRARRAERAAESTARRRAPRPAAPVAEAPVAVAPIVVADGEELAPHELAGDPDLHYVAPLATGSGGRQRGWLACVLLLALGLPALVVGFGYNRGPAPAEAAAAPATTESTVAESTTSEAVSTESTRKRVTTTTTEAPTTTSSTEAPTTTTTWATTSSTVPATTSTTVVAIAAAQPAPTTTAAPAPTTTTTVYVAPAPVSPAQDEATFLACVRQRESRGNYGAVSPDGLYRGAYQFHQATWDNTARMAGRPDLVGVPPNLASPADQDLLAVTLYRAAGAAPWGGACR